MKIRHGANLVSAAPMGLCQSYMPFNSPEVETSGYDMGRPAGAGEVLGLALMP